VRQAMRSGRGGRCVVGWLSVRGLFAMRGPMRAGWLHSRGALRCTGCDAMRCDARDAMREPMRCELVAMQCAALRCAARCADCLRYNALHAGWLHSRGAGGAMLLTEGFLGWLSRFKLIRLRRISLATLRRDGWRDGRRDGQRDGWAVCEVWADG
jgi:hypothetical protein